MKVLVVGGGGREHALLWKLSQSPLEPRLFAAPGNAGTALLAQNLPLPATDIEALGKAALSLGIELTVVGPEAPLAQGITDHFQSLGLRVFGPTRGAARIEASKVFSRQLMEKYGIPCPQGRVFTSFEEAEAYLDSQRLPIVVKADGLAAGKGVAVATTRQQALEALRSIMVERVFGDAGNRVMIDECLTGREVSLLAVTDGETVLPLAPACDYKRAYDGDQGGNTGGMGGYSPPPFFPPEMVAYCQRAILAPAVRAMAREGFAYQGVLYAGLMLTDEGPRVLEFNCRFGDPETQVILPRLKSDLLGVMLASVEGRLAGMELEWSPEACVGVVMASAGYPGEYRTGMEISGSGSLPEGVLVFHAGTRREVERLLTAGGRVLTVVACGPDLASAREKVYRHLPRIHFEGCHYRRDIALAGVEVCP